jgi:hypothetical protein
MSVDDTFFEQGFRAAVNAMADAVAKANLHLRPERLSRSVRARCLASYRMIAAIVRRLVFLMALQVELPPVRERAPQARVKIDGAEDVTASFGPQIKAFQLSSRPYQSLPEGLERAARPVSQALPLAAPVIARWVALGRVLKYPEVHARRLAFSLRRWREAGELAPVCAPLGTEHLLPAELGLIARALPQLIRKGLEPWRDTS